MTADAVLRRLENASSAQVADVLALVRAEHGRLAGDLPGARKLFGTLVSGTGSPLVRKLALSFLAETLAAAEEVEAAEALLVDSGFDRLIAEGGTIRPLLLAARGAVRLVAGRFSEAFEDLSACVRLPKAELSAHTAVLRCRGLMALAAAGEGRHQEARAAARVEQEIALTWGAPAYVGWALYVRAIVDDENATKRLEDAIDLLDVARSPVALARASHELGVRLVAEGDHAAAKRRFERAGQLARRIGNERLAARVDEALSGFTDFDQRFSLTVQELKIAELARTGYSNKQIAERLVLTVRTIEFHLSNVYRKLGVSGRRELMDGTSIVPRPD
ncbi:LuxR C-terminal-related transcriptional regulator [Amycolatopsis thailandensis]|uniref:LuxR C-terminal-related transcriptional regulator n=1 Tax=Amycolatopsis thailandensis TaxID=589330 RepID=UPI0036423D27